MLLKYRLERDDGNTSEITATNEAVYEVVRELAIEVGVIQKGETGGKRAVCTLTIENMLKTYKGEHGVSGLTDAVEAELRILHELHPDRILVRKTCGAHKGISCDYAHALTANMDECSFKGDCPFAKEAAV